MVLEAIMICLDNSEWMRNGDCGPTRFEAQKETVELIANTKINDNAESTVGILSMAGNRIDVNISPCRDMGAIMTAIAKEVKVGGKSNVSGSFKTAQLALKNRINKNQRQRIIMFVGSPIQDDTEELVKVGKNLKKNNVAVDVINFGAEAQENAEKLDTFLNAVNNSDNSHLLNIPPGPHVLSDLVTTSPVLSEGAAVVPVSASAGASGNGNSLGAVDPNIDPDLAMALRESMEEARQKLAEEKKTAEKPPAPKTQPKPSDQARETDEARQKLAGSKPQAKPSSPERPADTDRMIDEGDDDELQRALAMSMGSAASDKDDDHPMSAASNDSDIREALADPDFMSSLLGSVPESQLTVEEIMSSLTDSSAKDKSGPKDGSKKDQKDPKDPKGPQGSSKS